MSYILDALKKAESEREQGGVPGLHSQPMAPAPDGDDDDVKARVPTQPIVWVGAGVALCLIAVLSWKLISRDEAGPQAVATAPLPQAEPTPTQQQTPASVAQPPVVAHQPPLATQAPPAVTGMATRPAQPITPRADMPQQPPQRPAPVPPSGNPAATAAPPQDGTRANVGKGSDNNAGGAPTNTPQGGQRVPGIQELPDDVRREIPQITVGGAMYSEIPSQRMLIINSQVFREGDQPYQGLVLEEIRLKSAVFKYRGYRYSVSY